MACDGGNVQRQFTLMCIVRTFMTCTCTWLQGHVHVPKVVLKAPLGIKVTGAVLSEIRSSVSTGQHAHSDMSGAMLETS